MENLEDDVSVELKHDKDLRRKDARSKPFVKKRELLWKFGHEREFDRSLFSDMEEGRQKELLRRAARLTRDVVRVKSSDELHELRIHHSGIVRSHTNASLPVLPSISKVAPRNSAADQVREIQCALRLSKKGKNRNGGPDARQIETQKTLDRRLAAKWHVHLGHIPEAVTEFVLFVRETFKGDLRVAYRAIDGNNNHAISFSELLQMLSIMKYVDARDSKRNKSAITALFHFMDPKRVGVLKIEHFNSLIRVQNAISEYEADCALDTPEETLVADDTAELLKGMMGQYRMPLTKHAQVIG